MTAASAGWFHAEGPARVAVDRAGGCKYKPFNAGLFSASQNVERAGHVYIVCEERVFDRLYRRHFRGMMDYIIDTYHSLVDRFHLPDIGSHDRYLCFKRFDIALAASGEVVVNDDFMPFGEQQLNDVAADKTCSAGNHKL